MLQMQHGGGEDDQTLNTNNIKDGEEQQRSIIVTRHPIPSDSFEESVYSLIPEEYEPPQKQDMYRSKFAPQAKKEYWSGLKSAASMGPVKVRVNDTQDFLKKGLQEKHYIPAQTYKADRIIRKAPMPEPGEAPPSSAKDFISQNALDIINADAKKPNDKTPVYRAKKDYGRNPNYLTERKKEQTEMKLIEMERLAAIAAQKRNGNGSRDNGVVPLPDEERLKILEGLKLNWEKLNSDYQKLSLTVDTVPKIARKVNMEQQLKQLETHISKFSNPNVYVNFEPVYSK